MKNTAITKLMSEFVNLHPELKDQNSVIGKGLFVCVEFLQFAGFSVEEMTDVTKCAKRRMPGKADELQDHFWINIDGLNIDFCARQFGESWKVPTVWHDL